MARFFTRRDNQYVSNYVPLPLNLMQHTAEVRQNKLDTANQLAQSIEIPDIKAIKELRHEPGKLTEDYKAMLEIDKYVGEEKNKISDILNSTDDNIEEGTRKIYALKTWKDNIMKQGGIGYNINESYKNQQEAFKEADKQKELASKDAYKTEWDMNYDLRGQYKGNVYTKGSTIEFMNIQDEVNKHSKDIEADINRQGGSYDFTTEPGFIYKTDTGLKEKTYNTIVLSDLKLLSEKGVLRENVDRQIQTSALNKGLSEYQRVLNSPNGTKEDALKAYEEAYNNEQSFQYSAFNYSQDPKTGKILIPSGVEKDAEGNSYKRNTIVGSIVERAGNDYSYKETNFKEEVTADPRIDYGSGGTDKYKGTISVDKFGTGEIKKTYGEMKKIVEDGSFTKKLLLAKIEQGTKDGIPQTDLDNLKKEYNKVNTEVDNYSSVLLEQDKEMSKTINAATNDVFDFAKSSFSLDRLAKAYKIDKNAFNRLGDWGKEVFLKEKIKENITKNGGTFEAFSKVMGDSPSIRGFIEAVIPLPVTELKGINGLVKTIRSNQTINKINDTKYVSTEDIYGLRGDEKTSIGKLSEVLKDKPTGTVIDDDGKEVEVDSKLTSEPYLIMPNAKNNYELKFGYKVTDIDGGIHNVTKNPDKQTGFYNQLNDAAIDDLIKYRDQLSDPKAISDINDNITMIRVSKDIKPQLDQQFSESRKKGDIIEVTVYPNTNSAFKVEFVKASDSKYGGNTYNLIQNGEAVTQMNPETNKKENIELVGDGGMLKFIGNKFYKE